MSGLYDMRFRHYDPHLRVFLSMDPLGYAASGFDLWLYVGGDPLNFIDPFGLEKENKEDPWPKASRHFGSETEPSATGGQVSAAEIEDRLRARLKDTLAASRASKADPGGTIARELKLNVEAGLGTENDEAPSLEQLAIHWTHLNDGREKLGLKPVPFGGESEPATEDTSKPSSTATFPEAKVLAGRLGVGPDYFIRQPRKKSSLTSRPT